MSTRLMLAVALLLPLPLRAEEQEDLTDKVYFVSLAPGELGAVHVMDIKGKNRRRVAKPDGKHAELDPAPSRDGKLIAYAAVKHEGASIKVETMRITVMTHDGQDRRAVTDKDEWACEPCWSPDGKRIAYTSTRPGTNLAAFDRRNWVCVIGADGKDRVELALGESPSWSPDGKEVLFTRGARNPGAKIKNFRVPADGKGEASAFEAATGRCLSYSPDGKWLAVFAPVPQSPNPALKLFSADGETQRKLSVLGEKEGGGAQYVDLHCRWSIDGKHLLTTSMPIEGGMFAVHAFDIETGRRRVLSAPQHMDMLGGSSMLQ